MPYATFQNSNFNYFYFFSEKKIVLSTGKACGILKFDDIVDEVVERDIQNGNFNEAVTPLKESGKYAKIVQL